MQGLKIVKSSKKYAESYCKTMDSVAREGKFLSVSSGYTLTEMIKFIKICHHCGYPQYFLINENNEAVGWCDIVRRNDKPVDVGYLGIGILKEYRGCGWGTSLMKTSIRAALKCGFNEIRLEVRESNKCAINVYKKLGFVNIGFNIDGVTTDGVSENVWLMSYRSRDIINEKFSRTAFFDHFQKIKYKFKP